jgi:hypothetical protein
LQGTWLATRVLQPYRNSRWLVGGSTHLVRIHEHTGTIVTTTDHQYVEWLIIQSVRNVPYLIRTELDGIYSEALGLKDGRADQASQQRHISIHAHHFSTELYLSSGVRCLDTYRTISTQYIGINPAQLSSYEVGNIAHLLR